ncbi:MAG TPA: hypothetical protein GX503_00375, partial [Clostridiales bacterium]|nr:hypothetical protein [Clostridiales bacterium]
HATVAKLLGYQIESIKMFALGGVVVIKEKVSASLFHEILISLSGPLTNFLMASIAFCLLDMQDIHSSYREFFIYSNFAIGIFNLLPIIPLDGGRIAREIFAYFIGIKKSIQILGVVSILFNLILFLGGCYAIQYHPLNALLMLMAVFLFISVRKEQKMASFRFMREMIQKKHRIASDQIYEIKYLLVSQELFAKEVFNCFIPKKYHIVLIVDPKQNIIGALTETEIFDGIIQKGWDVSLEKLLSDKQNDKI